METSELLKKVRKIEIKTKKLISNLFTGQYHSAFKGRGMLFSEVRNMFQGMMLEILTGMLRQNYQNPISKYLKKKEN